MPVCENLYLSLLPTFRVQLAIQENWFVGERMNPLTLTYSIIALRPSKTLREIFRTRLLLHFLLTLRRNVVPMLR